MERLDFNKETKYSSIEGAIHLNRYAAARAYVRGKRVLDVACGEGYGSYLMKEWGAASVVGIDISEAAIEIANTKFKAQGIEFLVHDVEQIPFVNGSFDVIVSLETIEHLNDPEQFLREISRVSKFGGQIILSCPNDPYYTKSDPNFSNPFHKNKYNFFEFKELSQKYLSDHVDWYLGFALNGYMNYPISLSTLPEKDSLSSESMELMLKMHECSNSFLISPDRYINHWNCCYFLGIWNGSVSRSQKKISAVFFPREVFIEPDDIPYMDITALGEQYRALQKETKEKQQIETTKYLSVQKEFNEKLRVLTVQNERLSCLYELSEKERPYLLQRLEKSNRELQETSNKLQKKQAELQNIQRELQAMESELVKNRSGLDELHLIKSSRSFYFVQKYWQFRAKLRSILKPIS